jgi:predicted amidohydrolase
MDIKIVNGRIIDPQSGFNGIRDISISGKRIASSTKNDGSPQVINADGYYVLPGLIDFHTHLFEGSGFGLNPDLLLPTGVTSAVDAGSTGAAAFEYFYKKTILSGRIRIRSFINVYTGGQPGYGVDENLNPEMMNLPLIQRLAELYEENIIGLKLRFSKSIVGNWRAKPLERALEIASSVKLPLCVHVTDSPIPIKEIALMLRPGDIICHVHHGQGETILNKNGEVYPEIIKAQERGVIFDTAVGRINFNFSIARAAIEQGFLPDIISSDMTNHSFNRCLEVKNLPYVMSKYLFLGISLEEVVRRTTCLPARYMGMEKMIGALQEGFCADVVICELIKKPCVFKDNNSNYHGTALLLPKYVICDGAAVYCAADFSPCVE